jgi:REP element-mobilizing transposase RayT
MSHSFTHLLYHIVFATKDRQPDLAPEIRPALFAYVGGVVRAERGIALAVNGVADHVHLLVRLRQDRALAEVVRAIKAHSSHWVRARGPAGAAFAWQTGCGAFSVSRSGAERVREYVRNQEEHHRHVSFEDEYRRLLAAHGFRFTEKELWG